MLRLANSLLLLVVLASPVAAKTLVVHRPVHVHHLIQLSIVNLRATALVPEAVAAPRPRFTPEGSSPFRNDHEIDGLSRDANDCVKYGCTDH